MTNQFNVDMRERLESLSSLASKLAEEEQNSLEVKQFIKHLLLSTLRLLSSSVKR